MKKFNYFILLVGALLTFSTVIAQKDSSGIYLTANDFKAGKLSYAINYKTEKHKINDYVFLNIAQVKVKHHGKTYMLDKNNIYGYKSTKGEEFRFVNNQQYKILNLGEQILIYEYTETGPDPRNPLLRLLYYYYFTTDAANPPVELTKENLKKAFPENQSFNSKIEENFKTDEDLITYDKLHKMYKLNWLLK